MHLQLRDPILSLQEGQVVTLDDAAGRRICAHSGTVWITEEGALEDRILEGGACITVERDGRTLVQALAASLVAIQ